MYYEKHRKYYKKQQEARKMSKKVKRKNLTYIKKVNIIYERR